MSLSGSADRNPYNRSRRSKTGSCKSLSLLPISTGGLDSSGNGQNHDPFISSWWEGFGNPPVETAIHGLPVVVGDYPVAQELRRLGFKWFYPWEISAVTSFLASPDRQLLEHNWELAERHFSIAVIQSQVRDCLDRWGWL